MVLPLRPVLYAAIFLDLFGFGMIIPDIQLRAEALGAPGWLIGAMLASTFVVQLFVSPAWGKASDSVGRKPILLICTLLSAGGMFVYGVAGTVWLLLASRVISGLGGANVAIAQALLADATTGHERTKAMGQIGAAVTVGLIGGPVLGGVLAQHIGSGVGLVAGGLSAFGAVIVLLGVPSVPPKEKTQEKRRFLPDLSLLRDLPRVRQLAVVAAIAWFSLATLEGTFGRMIKHTLGFGQEEFGIVFGYESLLGFLVQAFVLGWIAKRTKEQALLRVAYVMQGLGLALMPFTYLFPAAIGWLGVLLFFSTLYAIGTGLSNPTVNSLCSKLTPPERQGELFGMLQGTRSVGFVVGPILGGYLFDLWSPSPYLVAGFASVVAAALVPGDAT